MRSRTSINLDLWDLKPSGVCGGHCLAAATTEYAWVRTRRSVVGVSGLGFRASGGFRVSGLGFCAPSPESLGSVACVAREEKASRSQCLGHKERKTRPRQG